jgi:hypothetical protein
MFKFAALEKSGVRHVTARDMVNLSLDCHIPVKVLASMVFISEKRSQCHMRYVTMFNRELSLKDCRLRIRRRLVRTVLRAGKASLIQIVISAAAFVLWAGIANPA